LSGTFGYSLPHYLLVKYSKAASAIEKILIEREGTEVNELGRQTITFRLNTGKRLKYRNFLKNLRVPHDYKDIIKKDPDVLYRKAYNADEALLFLYIKSLNPSSAEAFDFRSGSKQHTPVAHVHHAMTVSVKTQKKEESETIKTSLYGYIKKFQLGEPMSRKMVESIHTEHELYDYLDELHGSLKPSFFIGAGVERPHKLITFLFSRSTSMCSLRLSDVARYVWFKKKIRGAQQENINCWEVYSNTYNWLKPTVEETVEASPFKDEIGLSDFIKSNDPKTSTVKVLGPIRKNYPFEIQIRDVMKMNYFRGQVAVYSDEKIKHKSTSASIVISSKLTLFRTMPVFDPALRDRIMLDILEKSPSMLPKKATQVLSELTMMSDGDAKLGLIQWFAKHGHQITHVSFRDLLNRAKRGIMGFYTERQTFDPEGRRYMGSGVFNCSVDGKVVIFEFTEDRLMNVITKEPVAALTTNKEELSELMMEIGLKSGRPVSIREEDEVKAEWHFDVATGIVSQVPIPGRTAPITVRQDIEPVKIQKFNLRLKSGLQGTVRLIMETEAEEGKWHSNYITVLSYRPSVYKFTSLALGEEVDYGKPHLNAWLNYKSIEVNDGLSVLEFLYSNLHKEGFVPRSAYSSGLSSEQFKQAQGLKSWMKDTLRSKLDFSYRRSDLILWSEKQPDVNDDKIFEDDRFRNFDDDGNLIMDRLLGAAALDETWGEDSDDDFLDFLEAEKKNWDQRADEIISAMVEIKDDAALDQLVEAAHSNRDISPPDRVSYQIEYIHPFWDLMIREIKNHHGLYESVVTKTMPEPKDKPSQTERLILWLLDGDEDFKEFSREEKKEVKIRELKVDEVL